MTSNAAITVVAVEMSIRSNERLCSEEFTEFDVFEPDESFVSNIQQFLD
jgi:hypothetical protein